MCVCVCVCVCVLDSIIHISTFRSVHLCMCWNYFHTISTLYEHEYSRLIAIQSRHCMFYVYICGSDLTILHVCITMNVQVTCSCVYARCSHTFFLEGLEVRRMPECKRLEVSPRSPPCWPSGYSIRLKSGRSGVWIPLTMGFFGSVFATGFFRVELYQWLKNWHSSGYPARRLGLKGQCWD